MISFQMSLIKFLKLFKVKFNVDVLVDMPSSKQIG
jgi:hypothetical protein